MKLNFMLQVFIRFRFMKNYATKFIRTHIKIVLQRMFSRTQTNATPQSSRILPYDIMFQFANRTKYPQISNIKHYESVASDKKNIAFHSGHDRSHKQNLLPALPTCEKAITRPARQWKTQKSNVKVHVTVAPLIYLGAYVRHAVYEKGVGPHKG